MIYTLILADGSKTKKDGPVSDHISDYEASCHHCGQAILFDPMIQLFEATRDLTGPITINSFYRCPKRQQELVHNGAKAAKKYPPHTYGVAMDLAIPPRLTGDQLICYIYRAANLLGYPRPRIGYYVYNKAFVHVDLGFMLRPNPCPKLWYPGAVW